MSKESISEKGVPRSMGNLSDWKYHLCDPNPRKEVCTYAHTIEQSVCAENGVSPRGDITESVPPAMQVVRVTIAICSLRKHDVNCLMLII